MQAGWQPDTNSLSSQDLFEYTLSTKFFSKVVNRKNINLCSLGVLQMPSLQAMASVRQNIMDL